MSGPTAWLVRHGETEWSANGRHTSRTDLALTEAGRREALEVKRLLAGQDFSWVASSPRQRARVTAELAGFQPEVDQDLAEWDYGDLEGLTTPQIRETYPGWTIWEGPWPGGEDAAAICARADRVVGQARSLASGERALLFAHGHILRAVTARWASCPVSYGRVFSLGTGTVSVLGWEHGQPAVEHWNVPPDFPPAAGKA